MMVISFIFLGSIFKFINILSKGNPMNFAYSVKLFLTLNCCCTDFQAINIAGLESIRTPSKSKKTEFILFN